MKGSDINGICFLDENNNGVYDEGEKTLEGVKVVLYRQAIGKELLNTVSDENGRFTFANIRGSTFRVKFFQICTNVLFQVGKDLGSFIKTK